MRTIFTVHAGEYLVACEIESKFKELKVWVPSKDNGIDLLVTDGNCKKLASIQVKFSKDHLATGKELRATEEIKSGGWWQFDSTKLGASAADYWVLVLCEFNTRNYDYVVVPKKELVKRYSKISPESKKIQSYFWVTASGKCWETRGLKSDQLGEICQGIFKDKDRDFTGYLNNWPF